MFGYMGKILRVNLTSKKVTEESLDKTVARRFLGGRGLGIKILFDELKPGIDPLGPENKSVVATGILTGIPIPGSARFNVASKSPLTGILGESPVGGFFGQELKFAGYDAIIVEGASDSPVYIWIHEGEAEIRDASHLWGKFTRDTQREIKKEVKNDRAQVGCIGPAGENLVKVANVLFGFNHMAGRTGNGAVWGSKKLKAIAVQGTQRPRYYDEEKIIDLALDELADKGKRVREGGCYYPNLLDEFGSQVDFDDWQETGRLPTMNFRRCTFPGAEKIGREALKNATVRVNPCPYCTIPCNRVVEVHYPYEVDPDYGGPEYEGCAALGSFIMNDDLPTLLKAHELCNKYGMDAISIGVIIAFAMECYEKDLITRKQADGLDLSWGNSEAIIQLIEKIAGRNGIGNILAEGVKRASEKIGKGAENYAMHIKGMEMPMHEGRGKKGHGLSFAISNRGACHLQMESDDLFESIQYPEIGIDKTIKADKLYAGPEKVKLVKIVNDLFILYDCLPICRWTVYPLGGRRLGTFASIINAATGWDVTVNELMTVGERVCNLERAFNAREGITRKDDVLPKRIMEEPLPDGPYKDETFPKDMLDKMLDHWYELRGWNKETGVPTRGKLKELKLEYVANELETLGLTKSRRKHEKD
ncbi:MAG: aldehyde ferredoxin oxidoreductase family protein [Candidatus Freyarchaeota archaeon]